MSVVHNDSIWHSVHLTPSAIFLTKASGDLSNSSGHRITTPKNSHGYTLHGELNKNNIEVNGHFVWKGDTYFMKYSAVISIKTI